MKFEGLIRTHPVSLSICLPPPPTPFALQTKFGGFIGITFLSVHLSRVNLTLSITFQPKEIRLSYYTCEFLVTRPFCLYQKFWPCDLNLDFWHIFEKKLNLCYNFWTRRNGAFILKVCISCGKTFLSVPKVLTLWLWPWLLTFFWKNLTGLGHKFLTKSDRVFILHMCIPRGKTFLSALKFDPLTLALTFDLISRYFIGFNTKSGAGVFVT